MIKMVIIEGPRACFTRPEMKTERVTYDVPTPSALEGILKGVYWKPAMRYVIDEIVVFNPIRTDNIMLNEVSIKSNINGDPHVYASENRIMRNTMFLKNVKYGVKFHIKLTGIRCERENKEVSDPLAKHYEMFDQRIRKGQTFKNLHLGLTEFPCSMHEVEHFDYDAVSIANAGTKDLGYMIYGLNYRNKGYPVNNDWDNPVFDETADPIYYHPFMVNGVINVAKYRETCVC